MSYIFFDIETNGLLDTLDTVHCISFQFVDDDGDPLGEVASCNDHGSPLPLAYGLACLENADCVIGHNIAAFDIPALAKVYPGFKVKDFRDTLLLSTLAFPDLTERDCKKRKKLPGKLIGRHSLEAWGYRLGCRKGDYAEQCKASGIDPWAEWNQEMDDYCMQDVRVTYELYMLLLQQQFSKESVALEHAVAPILARQHKHGFLFDEAKALDLEQTLIERRAEITSSLAQQIEPWQEVKRTFVPKRDDKRRGYKKGVEVTTYRDVTFNPGSRDHIANRLKALYGWEPKEFTDNGKPRIDEEVLSGLLKYPITHSLLDYFIIDKRLGQLSEGKEAWLKSIAPDGRIHGSIHQNAAVTGRMTHSRPNMAQVPRVGSPYGKACRELFCAPPGKVLVGVDASGLELRCLAHYMARHDDGAYAQVILDGDIHALNQDAAGLPTRNDAKTFIYAFLYGAGDAKLGSIIGKGQKAGTLLRQQFLWRLPALGELVNHVKAIARERKGLRGLDGRKLHIRSQHVALNTLLQSAGALVMKQALILTDTWCQKEGYVPGIDYEFVANIHDEFQIEAKEMIAAHIGTLAVQAIQAAGEHFKFRCPLDGEYKVGANWAQTH